MHQKEIFINKRKKFYSFYIVLLIKDLLYNYLVKGARMIMTLKEKVEEVDQSVLEKKEETLDKENLEVKNDVSLDDSCEETKKETDEEIKSDEVVSNEEKKETPSIDYEGDIPFFELEPIVDPDEAVRLVNESRISFTEFQTKTMKNTKILQIVFLIIVAGAIFAASFFPQMLTITIFLVSFYFILMFFQTKRTRKKINDYVEDYIVKYGLYIDSYVYGNNYMLKDIKLAYKHKIDLEEIIKNDIYKNVIKTQSRDYVKGKMLGVNFYCSDVSFKVGNSLKDKNYKVPAVGKMFKFNLRLKNEGKVIIYLSSTKEGKPTNLDGLELTKIKDLDEKFEVYASSLEATKVITPSLIKSLSSFEIDDNLLDLVININSKETYVLLSYCDKIMVIPYDKPYEKESLLQYNKDTSNVIGIVNSLINSKEMNKY